MFTLVFKRSDQPYPELMGATHVSHADILASAKDVEWVQIITSSGYIIKETTRGETDKMTEAEYQQFNNQNRAILTEQERRRQSEAYEALRAMNGRSDELDTARMDGESLNGGECESYGPFNLRSDHQTIVDIWF